MPEQKTLTLGTRGSALALEQARQVQQLCSKSFPSYKFEVKIIKTTGDKLQSASLASAGKTLPKGLFTKEIEKALADKEIDIAVHSLKDLPVELPDELNLAAVCKRADPSDVLIYRSAKWVEQFIAANPVTEWSPGQPQMRGFKKNISIDTLPENPVIATSSARRQSQVLHIRPDAKIIPIRGNVATRLRKLIENPEFDATILAAAGISRLKYRIRNDGTLTGPEAPDGIMAFRLNPEQMIPAVGQGAIALEIRNDDKTTAEVCDKINHFPTLQCVTAERAFLSACGGGCHSAIAAHAVAMGHKIKLRAVSFETRTPKFVTESATLREADQLGRNAASRLA
ncbi:MAG: hydroxymethylbilane synthase [Verrucomicrobia bacterium]|nr:hydroxymethylbilane synthase [Verrucomicrobiota bacterium]MCF7707711.1 hydroxymethylbilane synthase [Verrucomicrobiota bacterium]